jgi:hypothetical protein
MSFLNQPQYGGILHALDPCAVEDHGKASPDAPAQDEIDNNIEGEKEMFEGTIGTSSILDCGHCSQYL